MPATSTASLTQKLDQGGAAHLAWSMLHMIRGEAQYQNQKRKVASHTQLFWLRTNT